MSLDEFTIGCDPEVFVKKNNKVVSAHGLIKGDKKNPHKIVGGAYQVDGMATEFNTDPISLADASSPSQFSDQVLRVFQKLSKDLPEEFTLARNLATADFDKEYLDEQPDEAKELGCEPDYNAYTGKMNTPPKGDDFLFRTAAGHIHIGWGADIPADHPDHMAICCEVVKTLDFFIGIPSVVQDRDSRRRLIYGKAGAFRPKSYGVEYRTPSNFWIFNAENRVAMGSQVRLALSALKNAGGRSSVATRGVPNEIIQKIIDTDDVEEAKKLVRGMPVLSYRASKVWGEV